jgi:threonine dehydrogenase-like Zn-dependent dehydrogenase
MEKSMRAAVLTGPGQFSLQEVAVPLVGPGQVLVRVQACAVCGSDLTVYKMGFPERILGHEFAGEIAAVGCGTGAWKVGDRVVIEPQLACGECHWCRTGQVNLCDSLEYTGLAADGGFAEYAVVPAYQLHRLPDEVGYRQGALVEPLSVALRGIRFAGVVPGVTVAVFGCGAIGLFAMLWARSRGAGMIIGTDTVSARREAAGRIADTVLDAAGEDIPERISALAGGIGPEIIMECSGSAAAQCQAIDTVRKGGCILLLGIGYEDVSLSFMNLTTREITIKGSLGYSSSGDGEFEHVIESIRSGTIDLEQVPVAAFPLEEIGKAFEASLHGDVTKAVVIF